MKKNLFLALLLIVLFSFVVLNTTPFSFAATYDSVDFEVNNPVITSGQQNSSSTTYRIGQSLSQTVTGKASSTDFQLWSGFQYFFQANSNTLTATAGDSQALLSWSVPQTFLGINVGGYELGTGTSSGVYTYQSLGNVTSFTKTALANGVQYFFKIRSKTLGGTILSFSNEASATPTGGTGPSGGGGGGGSGGGGNYGSGKIIFSGFSYPGSQVFLLKDAQLVTTTNADGNGSFQINAGGLGAGQFEFALYAKDSRGARSPLILETEILNPGENKAGDNILIPPTISLNNIEVKQGDAVNVFGFAQKNSQVSISLQGPGTSESFQTQSGDDGSYSFNIQTEKLALNKYQVFAKSFFQNISSQDSQTVEFTVGNKTVPAPALTGCPLKGDLNGDCRVDLVDFSILAYWYQKTGFPADVDLNGDGIIDLVDFSILAYNWTG